MLNDTRSQHPPATTVSYRSIVLLLLGIIATRLPFLWTGYGSDADAWMIADAADTLWHTGEYTVSRFPGYPLYEILSAPFVGIGGSVLSNGMTLLASIILLYVWHRIAELRLPRAGLLVLTLACTPLFWVTSAVTMDYIWSLLCLALSIQSVLGNRKILAALWFGLAIGFRLPNLVAVVPLVTLLYWHGKRSPKTIIAFIASASVVALLAYSPVLLRFGLPGWLHATQDEMSDIRFTWMERLQFSSYRTVYAVGPLAVLTLAAILFGNWQHLKHLWHTREPLLIASITGIVAFLLLFFFFPLDRAYLLPAVFFLLIFVASIASRVQLIIFALCSISFAFLNPDVIRHEGTVGSPGLNLHSGMVVEEIRKRNRLLEDRVRIATIPVAGKAMIMTGGGASFWFENEYVEKDASDQWKEVKEQVVKRISNPDIHFVAMLGRSEISHVRSLGYTVYCLDTARELVERIKGISMAGEHVDVIHR